MKIGKKIIISDFVAGSGSIGLEKEKPISGADGLVW